jgi:hypothetical protein
VKRSLQIRWAFGEGAAKAAANQPLLGQEDWSNLEGAAGQSALAGSVDLSARVTQP